jgi:hypothetical protein
VKVYELLDFLKPKNWKLQAEFQNVIESIFACNVALCISAFKSLNTQGGETREFNLDMPQLNFSKVRHLVICCKSCN